jgi:hypothetical protein
MMPLNVSVPGTNFKSFLYLSNTKTCSITTGMAKGKCSTVTKWKDTFDVGCKRFVEGVIAGRQEFI